MRIPLKKTFLLSTILLALQPAYVHGTEDRVKNATALARGFIQLNNTSAGQDVLTKNLETAIYINNNSTDRQRQQAIYDNTIAALVGSMSNGLLVAGALGTKMSQIFGQNNRINEKNYQAETFSSNFEKLFFDVNMLVQADSSFAKNFYANGSINGDLNNPAIDMKLPDGGQFNVYDLAYNPKNENKNGVGNSRPVQVAPDRLS